MSDYTTPSSILAITGSGKIGNQSSYKNDSNEAFLGEKFEFSNVLKSQVNSVEKTYSDAQNPKKPIENSLATNTLSSDQETFNKGLDNEVSLNKNSDLESNSNYKNESHYDKSDTNNPNNGQENFSNNGRNSDVSENRNQPVSSK